MGLNVVTNEVDEEFESSLLSPTSSSLLKQEESGNLNEISTTNVSSSSSSSPTKPQTDKEKNEEKERIEGGKLIKKEEVIIGKVNFESVKNWGKEIGGICICLCLASLFLLGGLTITASNWWISIWINKTRSEGPSAALEIYYLTGYGVLNVLVAVTNLVSGMAYANANLHGATKLHDRIFKTILHG